MNLRYIRMNPSGNITLLVTDDVPRSQQGEIANRLMQLDPTAEQVGFLEETTIPGARARLQMMGGEFCGNATMSLAAFLALQDDLPEGEEHTYPLEVSGAGKLIPCFVSRSGDCITGTVPMPLPREITEAEVLPGVKLPMVRFDGIDHIIIGNREISPEQAQGRIASLCAELNADALGMLFTDGSFSALKPLVYVRSTDSAVWENACGSGSAAIGAYCAWKSGKGVQLNIIQPCPDTALAVSAGISGGRVIRIEITGKVRMEKSARAEI